MTVSINGSGGITYPDGSTNSTRSASTAGDTFTGPVQFNSGLTHKGSGDFTMERTDGFDYSFVVSTAHNATGRGVFFQKAGGGAIAGSWNFRGKVLKPDQPSFSALKTTSQNVGSGVWTNISSYNSVNHNVGSHFNASTGIFTAPVAGQYLFSFAARGNDGNSAAAAITIRILKNSTMYLYDIWNGPTISVDSTYRSYVSASVVMEMSGNDTARLDMQGFFLQGNFSGILLA